MAAQLRLLYVLGAVPHGYRIGSTTPSLGGLFRADSILQPADNLTVPQVGYSLTRCDGSVSFSIAQFPGIAAPEKAFLTKIVESGVDPSTVPE